MDNQQQTTPVQQPYVHSQNSIKKSKAKPFVILLIILLLGALGYLGYTYKTTNDSLKKKSQDLSSAYTTIQKFQKIIDANKAEKDFVGKNNTASLSRSLCNGHAVLMSDVHLSPKFAVFRYLCENASYSIRIGSMKKLPDNSYEFTYGDGTAQTNRLPSYIYDDEPAFFATYGVTRF
jgi:hypothetical protein